MKKEFENIIGYEDTKEELLSINKWFHDDKILADKRFILPKGILFHGSPGNGKTLFIREFTKILNTETFVIQEGLDNLCKDISDTFAKARKLKRAVIVIDELDNLLAKDPHTIGTLKREMDGFDDTGHILVLGSANDLGSIDDALLREGRFSIKIKMDEPDKETRKVMLEGFLDLYGFSKEDYSLERFAESTEGLNCIELKTLINNLALRYGKKFNENQYQLELDAVRFPYRSSNNKIEKSYEVAVHEIGHAVLCKLHKDEFIFYKSVFTPEGGRCIRWENEKAKEIDKRYADIECALAGYCAEKVILGRVDVGCCSDIDIAERLAYRIITKSCVNNPNDFVSYSSNEHYFERGWITQIRVDRKVHRLMKKHYKKVIKLINKNKNTIICLAKQMVTNGEISDKDFDGIQLVS